MLKYFFVIFVFVIGIMASGCSTQKETAKEEPPSPPLPLVIKPTVPDIIIRIASIDLSVLARKIENNDIEKLTKAIRENKIDILTAQGITRYPELTSRIDFVEALAASAEMRKAFGENINISGRQTGNAVFSAYPIRSNENTRYENIRSSNFESALQTIIDCGVKDVVVVSTRLPDKASTEDQTTCVSMLSSFRKLYTDQPIFITGNLPGSEVMQSLSGYSDTHTQNSADGIHVWFSGERWVSLLHQTSETTPLGEMIVTEFGLFRKQQP